MTTIARVHNRNSGTVSAGGGDSEASTTATAVIRRRQQKHASGEDAREHEVATRRAKSQALAAAKDNISRLQCDLYTRRSDVRHTSL